MYFVTGGRKTQSALYRVSYTGPNTQPRELSGQEKARATACHKLRERRREVETLHEKNKNFLAKNYHFSNFD